MCITERAGQVANAAIVLYAEACYGPFHCLSLNIHAPVIFEKGIEWIYGTHARSIVDPVPKVNWNGRALTVFFECERAWEPELVLEVRAGLRGADGVYDKPQRVKG